MRRFAPPTFMLDQLGGGGGARVAKQRNSPRDQVRSEACMVQGAV